VFLIGWLSGIVSLAVVLVVLADVAIWPNEDELSGVGGFGTGFVITADGHVLKETGKETRKETGTASICINAPLKSLIPRDRW